MDGPDTPTTQSPPTPGACCSTGLTAAAEDYLKAILALASGPDRAAASTSGIADRIGVTSASVCSMVGRLRADGLVVPAGWGRVRLTEHGTRHAHSVLRRHRLAETFLHSVLGLAADQVHAEAEVLEHALSPRVTDLLDAALGRPRWDPHGAPIPAAPIPGEER